MQSGLAAWDSSTSGSSGVADPAAPSPVSHFCPCLGKPRPQPQQTQPGSLLTPSRSLLYQPPTAASWISVQRQELPALAAVQVGLRVVPWHPSMGSRVGPTAPFTLTF